MIVSGIHDDLDNPSDVPAFSLSEPKRRRKESLSETLTGAAVAFAKKYLVAKRMKPTKQHKVLQMLVCPLEKQDEKF